MMKLPQKYPVRGDTAGSGTANPYSPDSEIIPVFRGLSTYPQQIFC